MERDRDRRTFLQRAVFAGGSLFVTPARSQESATSKFPDDAAKYLNRIYAEGQRRYAYRADYPGGFAQWHVQAQEALRGLIGLNRIAGQAGGHRPRVNLEEGADLGDYTRKKGRIETEPDVSLPFWLLTPKGPGPYPLAVTPHGHDSRGYDSYAGVAHDDVHRRGIEKKQKDVAVQAVRRGFLAIAPATRGLSAPLVPDTYERHGKRDCRSQIVHCLLAGRTAIGERVWDMQRILDWALRLPEVDTRDVLMMGNSGGGMVTLYAAACDERITIAVPSCSFTTVAGPRGRIYHCDCNTVPGILEFGDLYDVAGLVAPRHLLAVNGREDGLHSPDSIEFAAERSRAIFEASGVPNRFQHRWGASGHRFYPDLMWPFVHDALQA